MRRLVLLVSVLMLVPAANTRASELPKPYVSADQGGGAYAPENTMVAMRNGIRLGVDELETDINITKDGELVLIHDGSLDRTTNCTGNVHDHTLADIEANCDAAYWWVPGKSTLLPGALAVAERSSTDVYPMRGKGVTVPTLREFLAYVTALGDRAPQVTMEIKNIPYDANFDPVGNTVADVLVPLVHEFGLTSKVVVESFWPASLQRVKALDPGIRTLFLTLGSATENLAYVAATSTEFSSPDALTPDLDQTYVDQVHALGRKVVPWLVDAPSDWAKVGPLGVDGVLSDNPACIMLAMGRDVPTPYVTPEAGLGTDVAACA